MLRTGGASIAIGQVACDACDSTVLAGGSTAIPESTSMNIIRSSDALKFNTPNAVVTPLATRRTGAGQVGLIHQCMQVGQCNPQHSHTTEEVMYILSGSVNVSVKGEIKTLHPGDVLIVPANTLHGIENAGDSSAEWLIISPAGMGFHDPNGNPIRPDWAE